MNMKSIIKIKKQYITPAIDSILLDNEISLALESAPPDGPDEVNNKCVPDYFNNDPFKSNLV